MRHRRRTAQQWFAETIALLYQWIATICMWAAIGSNYSHIRWYIRQHAAEKDWTAIAMALVVEAGIGLCVHQFVQSLRAALLSRGQISKQNRRFNRWLLPLFTVLSGLLAWFSARCNTAFFGGDKVLGWIAPSLTIAFAILEASKEILATRRSKVGQASTGKSKALPSSGQDSAKVGKDEAKTRQRRSQSLPTAKRREQVYRALCQDPTKSTTKDLAKQFDVTPETIRNDFKALAKANLIIYEHGKVRLKPKAIPQPEVPPPPANPGVRRLADGRRV